MNQLPEKIAAEIAAQGALPFARFMDLALYCPVYGYYEKEEDKVGRHGDYYTSASVGKLFGQLLACQFAEWFARPPAAVGCQLPDTQCHGEGHPLTGGIGSTHFQLVEAGAHRGDLALDILAWLREQRPQVFDRVVYWIIEPSDRRREWQQERLAAYIGRVRWVSGIEALKASLDQDAGPGGGITVLFSNELLDAMPVHRLGWDAKQRTWFEWGVALQEGRFAWTRLPLVKAELAAWIEQSCFRVTELAEVLPDCFTIEVSPTATDWWAKAAAALKCGKLVAIDYGGTAEELLIPERPQGTLRAYYRHQTSAEPLSQPGEQDLTAHVNFTALQRAGAAAGLRTESFVSQARFLTSIGAQIWNNEVSFGSWTPSDTRQFQTLIHPEHLGRAFRVLVQSRD